MAGLQQLHQRLLVRTHDAPIQYIHKHLLQHTWCDYHIPDYGGVTGVDYLDSGHKYGIWNDTIAILQALGYEVGKNLRAAPFDWRRGPSEYMRSDFPRLKRLIEQTYEANNNTPIAFVSLSMGSTYLLAFFNKAVTQEWKDKYVHSFTSWSGAFGGSIQALVASVDYNYFSSLSPVLVLFGTFLRNMMNSFHSLMWMYPIEQYSASNVTVTSGLYGTFKPFNWTKLLSVAGFDNAARALSLMERANLTTFQAPGVKTYCVYGYGVKTAAQFHYKTDFTSAATVSFSGDQKIFLFNQSQHVHNENPLQMEMALFCMRD